MPKEKIYWIKNLFIAIGYGSLFFFLIINILFSQRFPTLYFELLSNQSEAMINFLKQGKDVPKFGVLSPEIEQQFALHEEEIYKDERQRNVLIQKLEALLVQNPQSRDSLYSLYLLYDKKGDIVRAQEYLKKAKQIDPGVGQ